MCRDVCCMCVCILLAAHLAGGDPDLRYVFDVMASMLEYGGVGIHVLVVIVRLISACEEHNNN
jgi:hypothetical protein